MVQCHKRHDVVESGVDRSWSAASPKKKLVMFWAFPLRSRSEHLSIAQKLKSKKKKSKFPGHSNLEPKRIWKVLHHGRAQQRPQNSLDILNYGPGGVERLSDHKYKAHTKVNKGIFHCQGALWEHESAWCSHHKTLRPLLKSGQAPWWYQIFFNFNIFTPF